MHLIGDRKTSAIYQLAPTSFQDNGATIRSLIQTGHISHGTLFPKTSNELIMRIKRGAGGTAGNVPVFEVRWRNDNGAWSNYHQVSLGKIGDMNIIGRLLRLGQYRTRQWEFIHSDDTDFVLSDLEEDAEGTD
jgi:hypothetical protein